MTKREARKVGGGPQQPNPWFHNNLNLLGYDETLPIVNIRNLTTGSGEPFLRVDFPVAPNLMALSPDDKILYLVPRPVLHGREGMAAGLMGIPPGEPKNNKLIVVDVPTRMEKQRLTLPVANSIRELALSPDGRTLAMWTVADTRTEESRLFRVGIDGSGYRELYRGRGATIAWARDGSSIFFGQSDTGHAYCLGCNHDWQVMRIPAAGGKEQFTGLRVKGLQYISLSPDGKRLAFDGSSPSISSGITR
jgi:Tol biopolymer transport system component